MSKLRLPVSTFIALLFIIALAISLKSSELDFALSEYKERRERLCEQISDGVAIIANYSGTLARFRTDPEFLYLTGVDVPGARLILIPKERAVKSQNPDTWLSTLYLPPKSPSYGVWDDPLLSPGEEAERATAMENTAPLDSFSTHVARLGSLTDTIYLSLGSNFLSYDGSTSGISLVEEIKKILPHVSIKNLSPILDDMQWRKSSNEIAVMKKACAITIEAFKEVARLTKPGIYEYEVEALVNYIFRKNGSTRAAFTIIASGPNSCILHHMKNDRLMKDGDLLKIDIGTVYQSMATDLTRTIPVSGVFSPEQREVYSVVLKAQKKAISIVKPGVTLADVHKSAYDVIAEAGYGKYFIHGTSHTLNGGPHWRPSTLGLTLSRSYDAQAIYGAFDNPLVPGSMFTIEPGIYIPEKNIGIRIEDDILVTETGYTILTESAPKEIDDIEMLMKEKTVYIK